MLARGIRAIQEIWRLQGLHGVGEAISARFGGRQRYVRFMIDLASWGRLGAMTAYTHVADTNVASIRGVLKTGFRACGVVTLRWVFGTSWRRFERDDSVVPSPRATIDAHGA